MEGKDITLHLNEDEIEALENLRKILNVATESEAVRHVIKDYMEKVNIIAMQAEDIKRLKLLSLEYDKTIWDYIQV